MSRVEASSHLNPESSHVGAKEHRIGKKDNGKAQRRILGDISNLGQQPNQLSGDVKMQQHTSITAKEAFDQLEKENMALHKLITDRNKLIEVTGIETQRLRINMQKLQLQNMQLAQSNSQMLKELNLTNNRLKILQHELGCKNGIIATQKVELMQKNNTMACQTVVDKVADTSIDKIAHESSEAEANRVECQPSNMNRKLRSQSLGSSVAQRDNPMEKPKSKRVCLRRQSVRLKHEETEDPFETQNVKFPICSLPDDKSSDKKEQAIQECSSSVTGDETTNIRDSQRSSLGRPSRSASNKIKSYKEISLKVKMRRSN